MIIFILAFGKSWYYKFNGSHTFMYVHMYILRGSQNVNLKRMQQLYKQMVTHTEYIIMNFVFVYWNCNDFCKIYLNIRHGLINWHQISRVCNKHKLFPSYPEVTIFLFIYILFLLFYCFAFGSMILYVFRRRRFCYQNFIKTVFRTICYSKLYNIPIKNSFSKLLLLLLLVLKTIC